MNNINVITYNSTARLMLKTKNQGYLTIINTILPIRTKKKTRYTHTVSVSNATQDEKRWNKPGRHRNASASPHNFNAFAVYKRVGNTMMIDISSPSDEREETRQRDAVYSRKKRTCV